MSFGIQTINSNGVVGIDTTEVATRYIGSVYISRDFSGNLSLPTFDSARGSYFLTPYYLKYNFVTDARVADNTPLSTQYVDVMNQFGATNDRFSSPLPSLSWNNNTKLMSVTQVFGALSDYKLTLLHYK